MLERRPKMKGDDQRKTMNKMRRPKPRRNEVGVTKKKPKKQQKQNEESQKQEKKARNECDDQRDGQK